MLGSILETDYTVEKKKWWESVLALVIIIIAVVISYLLANPLVGAKFIAVFAGALSISLSIGGLLLSKAAGLSANGLVHMIGAFAQMSGYVAMITGIIAAYQSLAVNVAQAGRTAGAEVLKGQALKSAIEKVTISDMINFAVDSAIDSVSNMFTDAAQMSISEVASAVGDGIKLLQKVNDYMMDKEMQELEKEEAKFAAEEAERSELLASKTFMNGADTLFMEMDKISSYDAIAMKIDLDKHINSADTFKIEVDRNWYVSVNS